MVTGGEKNMGRIINLVIYCRNGKGRYKAYFEEKSPGYWYGIRAERMPDLSFFEKLSLKNSHKQKFGSSLLKTFRMENGSANENYTGEFCRGDLKCPSCGNNNFVKCGVCGELTCWNDASPNFVCAVCGNSGQVSGIISGVSANSSNNSKRTYSNEKFNNKKW